MAHLDDVELVGVERFGGEHVEAGRRGRGGAARHPAGAAADDESHDRGRRSHRRPATARWRGRACMHLVELEPRRHRLVGDGAVARADASACARQAATSAACSGCVGQPGGDGLAPVGRQFAVDIGVQLVLGHG